MKFSLKGDKVKELFDRVKIVSKSSGGATLPILRGIVLDCDEATVQATSNNLVSSVKTFVGADIDEPGTVCFDSELFGRFMRSISMSKRYVFETVPNSLNMKVSYEDELEVVIKGYEVNDFPETYSLAEESRIYIGEGKFEKLLRRTLYAMSNNEVRYLLHGLHFFPNYDNSKLRVVGTDGERLSCAAVDYTFSELEIESMYGSTHTVPGSDFPSFVIPYNTANEAYQLFKNSDEVWIAASNMDHIPEKMFITDGTTELCFRPAQTEHPKFDEVMRADSENRDNTRIKKTDLSSALNFMTPLVLDMKKKPQSRAEQTVRVEITPGTLTLTSKQPEDKLKVQRRIKTLETSQNEGFVVGVNIEYLLEAIKNIYTKEVVLSYMFDDTATSWHRNQKPITIASIDDEDGIEHITYLMPLLLHPSDWE